MIHKGRTENKLSTDGKAFPQLHKKNKKYASEKSDMWDISTQYKRKGKNTKINV